MALHDAHIKSLVCPKCRGCVVYFEHEQYLFCDSCQIQYPIHNDLPVMLVSKARRFERFCADWRMLLQAVDPEGEPKFAALEGSLDTISRAGISGIVSAPVEQRVRELASLKVNIRCQLPSSGESERFFSRSGMVVGITYKQDSDYYFHIRFDKLIDEGEFSDLTSGLTQKS